MAEKTVKSRVQIKRGTSAEWALATNFYPLAGEIIFYSDLNKIKVGNGTTLVEDLPFISGDLTIRLTWSELKALKDAGRLIPGQQYRITDYETTTVQEYTRAAGHQFDVIVTALSNKTLSEDAKADFHVTEDGVGDGYFVRCQEITCATTGEFIDDMSLDLITTRYILCEDFEDQYSTPHQDDKEIHDFEIRANLCGYEVPCLLNHSPDNDGTDYLFYCGSYNYITYTNDLVSILYSLADDSDEVLYEGISSSHKNDVFVAIDYKNNIPIMYKEDIFEYGLDSVDTEDYFEYAGDYILDGTTYNSWLHKGTNLENSWKVLTNIIVVNNKFIYSAEEFKAGVRANVEVLNKWQECDSDGTPHLGNYYLLTNNIVKNTKIDTLFFYETGANFGAWELKYCLDNDSERFGWISSEPLAMEVTNEYGIIFDYVGETTVDDRKMYLWHNAAFAYVEDQSGVYYLGSWSRDNLTAGDLLYWLTIDKDFVYDGNDSLKVSTVGSVQYSAPGKGVIYKLKDEYGNECPYDFKNIKFKRSKIAVCSRSPILVNKICGIPSTEVYYKELGKIKYAPYTIYYHNDQGQEDAHMWCYTFATSKWEDATIAYGGSTAIGIPYNNIIKACHKSSHNTKVLNNIVFLQSSNTADNFFDLNCSKITLLSNCKRNIFKIGCQDITLNTSCSNNSFGLNCTNIITGCNNISNTFGNGCDQITISNYNTFNVFGDFCQDVALGSFATSANWGHYEHIVLNPCVKGLKIICENGSESDTSKCNYAIINTGNYTAWTKQGVVSVPKNDWKTYFFTLDSSDEKFISNYNGSLPPISEDPENPDLFIDSEMGVL